MAQPVPDEQAGDHPFPEDRVSFAFDPLLFLGIALATVALGKGGDETRAWLVSVLDDPRCRAATPHHALLYRYIRWTLTGDAETIDDVRFGPLAAKRSVSGETVDTAKSTRSLSTCFPMAALIPSQPLHAYSQTPPISSTAAVCAEPSSGSPHQRKNSRLS